MNQGLTGEILIILGMLGMAAGILLQSYRRYKEPYKGRATAAVMEIVPGPPDSKGKASGVHDYFYAVFVYYAGSRLIKKRFPKGGNPCPFYLNQQVRIYYKLEDPELFKLAEPGPQKKIEQLLYAAGAALVVLGIFSYLFYAARYL